MMNDQLVVNGTRSQNIKVFGTTCALELVINQVDTKASDNSEYSSPSDKFYLNLFVAPSSSSGGYEWTTENCVIMKLSMTEVMSLASVFLRIKNTFKIENRKTSHRSHSVYKNLSVEPNNKGGLLFKLGIVPIEKNTIEKFLHYIPVMEMDCVRVGLFLLGFVSLKMPLVSTESIITALRLAESKAK